MNFSKRPRFTNVKEKSQKDGSIQSGISIRRYEAIVDSDIGSNTDINTSSEINEIDAATSSEPINSGTSEISSDREENVQHESTENSENEIVT